MKVELLVSLKIPDNTAITAKKALDSMGIDTGTLSRADYYSFEIDGDASKFEKDITKVDVIVNSNKHKAQVGLGKRNGVVLIVKNRDDKCEGLRHTLKERLGMKGVSGIERGVAWFMGCSKDTAGKAAEQLLHNRHFQDYRIL